MPDRGQDRGGKEEVAGGKHPDTAGRVGSPRKLDPSIAAVVITVVVGAVAAALVFWVQTESKTVSDVAKEPWILRYLELRNQRMDEMSRRVFRLEQMQMEGGK